ncbi:hypothetical protein F3Y22_tig00116984pilonHSYRG00343 [Hibiscus syriacus]|uniref:Uncharacterized protein n=1 Tax=Hibiscus syriacus TaxID=106335 RepID=A0A6A2XMS1_HIBSY|nr:hypothetical protein F3Y22_tig00116984pilonHSYRG00343 [Hibiscus syriacus]
MLLSNHQLDLYGSWLFFGIAWSIWLARNDTIFNNKKSEFQQFFDVVLLRIGVWASSLWPESVISISAFIRSPSLVSIRPKCCSRSSFESWVAPTNDKLKFNVDAAVRGNVELAAIVEACQIFSSSKWADKRVLIIETDSLKAVQWIENPSLASHYVAVVVAKCKEYCVRYLWEVKFEYRERKTAANALAQEGLNNFTPSIWCKVDG